MFGNALHRLFAFSQPRPEHLVTATFNENSEENIAEIPGVHRDTVLHLHRQTIRISRGKQTEDVTALLAPEIDGARSTP
jgi:hypothetical protein